VLLSVLQLGVLLLPLLPLLPLLLLPLLLQLPGRLLLSSSALLACFFQGASWLRCAVHCLMDTTHHQRPAPQV
jgi:hypothetical protein